jgi:hypothetical protein
MEETIYDGWLPSGKAPAPPAPPLPSGPAVPSTGKPLSIADLIEFASTQHEVDYIFWSTEDPFYSRDPLPFLDIGRR